MEKKSLINQELWQACAGPLVNLPAAGTHVVYFPQGHSEQVALHFPLPCYYAPPWTCVINLCVFLHINTAMGWWNELFG